MSADDAKAAADELVDFEDQEEEQEVAADAGTAADAKKCVNGAPRRAARTGGRSAWR